MDIFGGFIPVLKCARMSKTCKIHESVLRTTYIIRKLSGAARTSCGTISTLLEFAGFWMPPVRIRALHREVLHVYQFCGGLLIILLELDPDWNAFLASSVLRAHSGAATRIFTNRYRSLTKSIFFFSYTCGV